MRPHFEEIKSNLAQTADFHKSITVYIDPDTVYDILTDLEGAIKLVQEVRLSLESMSTEKLKTPTLEGSTLNEIHEKLVRFLEAADELY
jgi:O-succinylbenzoate synthase